MQDESDNGKPQRVLVVDNERALRNLFAVVLQRAGHQVETAASGEEAIERLSDHDYDVVFLDILLDGDVSGFDVFDEHERRGLSSRVVFVTGRPSDEKQMDYFRRASAFLTKPIRGLYEILEAVAP